MEQKKRILIVLLLCGIFAVFAAAGAGAAETSEEGVVNTELTKEEILTRLNGILQYNISLISSIPGMERMESAEGVTFEYYGTDIKELDRETLSSFLQTINQQLSYRILQNYQKLQKQLKDLKKIDDLKKTQDLLKETQQFSKPAGAELPKIPETYTPPKPYKPVRR